VSTVVQCRGPDSDATITTIAGRGGRHNSNNNVEAPHDDTDGSRKDSDRGSYRNYYLLVQRGKEPNLGLWSLPGGRLEWGEPTLAGALRELQEETAGWEEARIDLRRDLSWFPGTVCATDSIGDGYHYVIAQCFASLVRKCPSPGGPPPLRGADDASAARWLTRDEIRDLGTGATPGVLQVIDRVESLSANGLLPVG
jgi:ADP-ribose pyrophosphatase YjhB (NUDIX family)